MKQRQKQRSVFLHVRYDAMQGSPLKVAWMLPSALQELCADLGISTLDPVTLVLAWHCRAQQLLDMSLAIFSDLKIIPELWMCVDSSVDGML